MLWIDSINGEERNFAKKYYLHLSYSIVGVHDESTNNLYFRNKF